MRLLVDGDVLKYRCGYAAQHTKYNVFIVGEEEFGAVQAFRLKKEAIAWADAHIGEGKYGLVPDLVVEPAPHAVHLARLSIQAAVDRTNANRVEVYLSGKGNFREDLDPLYKAHRPPEKPVHYARIHRYLERKWDAIVVDTIEADDALGIEQWQVYVPDKNKAGTCIATIDKDLDMIPGWHYNFMTMEKYWIDEELAIRKFYIQLLTGDSVDNIPGIRGIGPKKAAAALSELDTEEEMYMRCKVMYQEAGIDEKRMLLNAQLLWILREPGELWEPPLV